MSEIRSNMTTPSLPLHRYTVSVRYVHVLPFKKPTRITEQALLTISLTSKIASRLTVVKFPLFAKHTNKTLGIKKDLVKQQDKAQKMR